MDRLSKNLQIEIDRHNRRITGEALVVLTTGVFVSIVVFGVVFWLIWLAFTLWFRSYQIGSASMTAMIVTGVFAVISIFSAWRKHDPFDNVQAMDDNLQALQIGVGFAAGLPIVNRQAAAGIASILIGGPANIFDSVAIWRTRTRANVKQIATAAILLHQSNQGVPVTMISDRTLLTILFRLGLIKVSDEQKQMFIRSTIKGAELLAKAMHGATGGRLKVSQ